MGEGQSNGTALKYKIVIRVSWEEGGKWNGEAERDRMGEKGERGERRRREGDEEIKRKREKERRREKEGRRRTSISPRSRKTRGTLLISLTR